jgi:hypothetical protein
MTLDQRIRRIYDAPAPVTIEEVREYATHQPAIRAHRHVRVVLALGFSTVVALGAITIIAIRPSTGGRGMSAGVGETTLPGVRPTVSTTPPAPTTTNPHVGGLSRTLHEIVPPGDTRSVHYRVPAGEAFALDRFFLYSGSTNTKQSGEVRIEQLTPGNPTRTNLVTVSLSQLDSVPSLNATLNIPIVFGPGQMLALSVTCNAHQAHCALRLVIQGTLRPQRSSVKGTVGNDGRPIG